jgi:hypothetical protein
MVMKLYENVNVLVADDSKGIEQLERSGAHEDMGKAHVIIHQGRVLKNAFGSKFVEA